MIKLNVLWLKLNIKKLIRRDRRNRYWQPQLTC